MIRIITIADPHLGESGTGITDGTANLTAIADYLSYHNNEFDLVVVLGDYVNRTKALQILTNKLGTSKQIQLAKGNHDGKVLCTNTTGNFGDSVITPLEGGSEYQLIILGACGDPNDEFDPGRSIITTTVKNKINKNLPTVVFGHYPTKCLDSWSPNNKTGCNFVDTIGLTKLIASYAGHVHFYSKQIIRDNVSGIDVLYITEDNIGGNGPVSDYIGYTCVNDNNAVYTRLNYRTGTVFPSCISSCNNMTCMFSVV